MLTADFTETGVNSAFTGDVRMQIWCMRVFMVPEIYNWVQQIKLKYIF